MTDKIDTPDKNQESSNVIYLNNNIKAKRKVTLPRRRRKYHWSSKKTDIVEIDLCADPESAVPATFVTENVDFRILFANSRSAHSANTFFALVSFCMVEFVSERPRFDVILHEGDVEAGRFFIVSIDGRLYFYCESKDGVGLKLLLQSPVEWMF